MTNWTNWTVSYSGRAEIIAASTYAEAVALVRARVCRGRRPYRTRAAALAHGTGPALPCTAADFHWHASDVDGEDREHATATEKGGRPPYVNGQDRLHPASPADLDRLQAHFARLDLDLEAAA